MIPRTEAATRHLFRMTKSVHDPADGDRGSTSTFIIASISSDEAEIRFWVENSHQKRKGRLRLCQRSQTRLKSGI